MAISNFGELKAAIPSWVDRSDLSAVMADFVALAEADIRTDLRCPAMEQYTSGTLTGATLAWPTRFLEARALTVAGRNYYFQPPEVFAAASDAGSTQRLFTSIGETFYVLGGTNGAAYTLIYYQAFAPFSADSDTNWLIVNHPNVYLWASCRQVGIYLSDDAMVSKFSALYQDALGRVASRQKQAAYSGSPLAIRTAISE